jgi:hypothetical protein
MTECKMKTILYFNVPLGEEPSEYLEELKQLNKKELIERITDLLDSEIELS